MRSLDELPPPGKNLPRRMAMVGCREAAIEEPRGRKSLSQRRLDTTRQAALFGDARKQDS